jgi:hypothetical protein
MDLFFDICEDRTQIDEEKNIEILQDRNWLLPIALIR